MKRERTVLLGAVLWLAAAVPWAHGQETAAPTAAEAAPAGERANDQTYVIGLGIGSHRFIPTHETGEPAFLEIRSTLLSQVYGEWYALDEIGFGARIISFGASATSTETVTLGNQTATAESKIEVDVTTYLATVTWVPLGGRGYTRMGLLAGAGITQYERKLTNDPGTDSTDTTSGPAALAGIYVDWGGEGFGARFGTQYLATALGDIDGESVDVTGSEFYLDLRWAF